jgi:GTPase SAR1 and related small G proteins
MQQLVSKQPVRVKCIILGSSGAGKTSFSRRYFKGIYEEDRHSTICADFYSRIIENPLLDSPNESSHKDACHSCNKISNGIRKSRTRKDSAPFRKKRKKKSSAKEKTGGGSNSDPDNLDSSMQKSMSSELSISQVPYIALQMWDTAGKERLLNDSAGLTSRLGDSFFRHANVALLVYDVTSSRSFLQLIKWHKELLERMNRIYHVKCKGDNIKSESYLKEFPIVIVGTKLDRLEEKQSLSGKIRRVPQRNVLGLKDGFKGMDYHYEYGYIHHTEIQHHRASHDGDLFHANCERKALKYGLEGGSWTSDTSYMDYLRLAEDECFPDRAMVRRWCRSNGLEHIEVSALENIGIDIAVNIAVSAALRSMENERMLDHGISHNVLDQQDFEPPNQCVPIILGEKSKKSGSHHKCTFCDSLLQIYERLKFKCGEL